MTIAVRGIVGIYREANRASDVHRKALGFSISRDDFSARVYVHYPEIEGEHTTYWRKTIKEINISNETETWTPHQFTLNVSQTFAPALFKRLKAAIGELPYPIIRIFQPVGVDGLSAMSSQDDSSASKSQDESFSIACKSGGVTH